MDGLAWLNDAGQRYVNRIRTEQPTFLVELEIGAQEVAQLLENLRRYRFLPWEPWAHSCVAVAAVQVAANAAENESSLVHAFLDRLKITYSQQVWEEEYGKRIEVFLAKYFPDDLPRSGAFRYVGPVYRHAGVPRIAVPQFAKFLRSLLDKYGPSFVVEEYQQAHEHVSGVARQFLGGEYGFQYTRDAARVLHHIDIGLIDRTELATIPGYRRNFWAEVIEAVGASDGAIHRGARPTSYSEPFLALSAEDQRLIVRFDGRAIAAGAVRMNGKGVLYPEFRINFAAAPEIRVGGRVISLRWWRPGDTAAALFRSSDGRFVASEGSVPPGSYYLVADESITPTSDLSPDELNYLDGSEYRIWRISVGPGTRISDALYASGNWPVPQIEFATGGRHPFGINCFEGQLPDLILRNWDRYNASRFLLFVDDGAGPRSLTASADCSRLPVSVCCPSTGAIWIESKGVFRQALALPRLPFSVLPKGIAVRFTQQCFRVEEPAFARISLAKGWRVVPIPTVDGLMQIPRGERLLEGVLESGDFRLPFSVRIPRVSLAIHPRERIWWREDRQKNRTLHIEGVPGLSCALWLLDDRGPIELTKSFRIGESGLFRLRESDFRDALDLASSAAGELALSVADVPPLPAGCHFASGPRIIERIWDAPDSSPLFKLPKLGEILRGIRNLQSREMRTLDCHFTEDESPVRCWLSAMALCAEIFDGTQLNADVSEFVDDAIRTLCKWYGRAVSCAAPGAPSAAILKDRPLDLSIVPLTRWKDKIQEAARRLELQSDLAALVREWRNAVMRLDGTATETVFANRPGGEQLTNGAEWYLKGMRHPGRTRQNALKRAIGELERCRERTDCSFVRATAAILLELAYEHSGRSEHISDILRKDYQNVGLSAADISPWNGDNGANIDSIGTMATGNPAASTR
jgi:hypothetical protein